MTCKAIHTRFVEEETAIIYNAYGRRFFTMKAALRWAAKRQIRDAFRATGDDLQDIGAPKFHRWVTHLASKLRVADRRPFNIEDPMDDVEPSLTIQSRVG
jgi:hypothetical protein